jgi:bifunctional non-homologous end joining protein LigD
VISGYAKRLAESLAADHRDLVVAKMAKNLRPGKVFLDWSQNNGAKTTICPYSLRGRSQPWVAAPRSWDELDDASISQLTAAQVVQRVEEDGDLAEALFSEGGRLQV